MTDQPKAKKRKKRKPPRCVLLDTRTYAELDGLAARVEETLSILRSLSTVLIEIGNFVRAAVPILSAVAAGQQKRSNAARKANATRQGAGLGEPQQPRSGFEAIVLSTQPGNGATAAGGDAEVVDATSTEESNR